MLDAHRICQSSVISIFLHEIPVHNAFDIGRKANGNSDFPDFALTEPIDLIPNIAFEQAYISPDARERKRNTALLAPTCGLYLAH